MKEIETMENEIITSITAWTSANTKPTASGHYIVWKDNGELDIYFYSAKYGAWNVFRDDSREFEKNDVEYWMAVVPPTVA